MYAIVERDFVQLNIFRKSSIDELPSQGEEQKEQYCITVCIYILDIIR